MSKYHPIDVRHPSNRAYLKRNFLLDPPRQDLAEAPRHQIRTETRAEAPRSTSGSSAQRTERRAQGTVAPWGDRLPASVVNRRAGRPTSLATTGGDERSGSWGKILRAVFFIGIALWIFGNSNSALWRNMIVQIRLWAANNGIALPF